MATSPECVEQFVPFREGARVLLIGSSGSGKSHFISECIRHRDIFFQIPPNKIVFCSHSGSLDIKTNELKNEMAKQGGKLVEFINQVPGNDEHFPPHTLLIFDDMLSDVDSDSNLEQILPYFRRRAHHERLYCLVTAQTLYSNLKKFSSLSQNANYLIHFKSPRSLQQIRHFVTQLIGAVNLKDIIAAFKYEMKNSVYPHFYFTFHPLDNKLLYLANLLEENEPIVFYHMAHDDLEKAIKRWAN